MGKETRRVIVCRVGRAPTVEHIRIERGSYLDAMQAIVGGNIEYVYLVDDAYMGIELVCNENGIGEGLPLNRIIPATAPPTPEWASFVYKTDPELCDPGERGVYRILGDFLLTRTDGNGETVDVTDVDVKFWTDAFEAVDLATAIRMNLGGTP